MQDGVLSKATLPDSMKGHLELIAPTTTSLSQELEIRILYSHSSETEGSSLTLSSPSPSKDSYGPTLCVRERADDILP